MNSGQKLLFSSGVASMVAPTIFAVYFALQGNVTAGWFLFMFGIAWVVTVFHLLLLGLPMFVLLESAGRSKWITIVVAGFAAGFVPLGALTFPLLSVADNDTPGEKVWLTYILSCASFGLLGTITAITFWRTWLAVADQKLDS